MYVCCISAKARHGKDTAALILKDYLESKGKHVLITHYADLVKFICTNYFNWDGKKDENGRSLLQHVGTDVVANQCPTFWVDFIINVLKFFENEWDYVLIPDCRYPIEAQQIAKHFKSVVLRVERPNFENNLTPEQKQHTSETAMDDYLFDYLIYNDSDIATLKKKLVIFTNEFLI
jgi:hypothetical protein